VTTCLSRSSSWCWRWRWRRTDRRSIDKLHVWCELQIWLRNASNLAILTCTLDERVDLGNSQELIGEVADIVRDHGTAVRAGFCVVVGVAVVWT
jgi:hypothetical protein